MEIDKVRESFQIFVMFSRIHSSNDDNVCDNDNDKSTFYGDCCFMMLSIVL